MRLEGHLLVLNLVPELFNAMQFWAIQRQEVKRQAFLLQKGQQGLVLLPFWMEALSRMTVSGLPTFSRSRPRKPPRSAAVVVSQNVAENNRPVDINTAMTFRRFPLEAVRR